MATLLGDSRRTLRRVAVPLFCALAAAQPSLAATCEAEDFSTRVSGEAQCLAMRSFGDSAPEVMLVWLHGDLSSGGPANYHFAPAQASALDFRASKVLAVALLRPGYADGGGASSSVDAAHDGRSDHYTQVNVGEVAAAIERLREHYRPKSLIVIGHSGGAATAAIMLGLKPGLIDAALLVACPCELVAWRSGRRAWTASENPTHWIARIAPGTRVIALTGDRDDNTSPSLARDYVEALKARAISAEFRLLPNQTHNGALRSTDVFAALRELIGA